VLVGAMVIGLGPNRWNQQGDQDQGAQNGTQHRGGLQGSLQDAVSR
jgi:hypothetical protein